MITVLFDHVYVTTVFNDDVNRIMCTPPEAMAYQLIENTRYLCKILRKKEMHFHLALNTEVISILKCTSSHIWRYYMHCIYLQMWCDIHLRNERIWLSQVNKSSNFRLIVYHTDQRYHIDKKMQIIAYIQVFKKIPTQVLNRAEYVIITVVIIHQLPLILYKYATHRWRRDFFSIIIKELTSIVMSHIADLSFLHLRCPKISHISK